MTSLTRRPVGPMAILSLSLILVLGMAGQPQAAKSLRRIGMLTGTGPTDDRLRREAAFRRVLLERGYIEGQDIEIVHRRAGGDFSLLRSHAQDLVQDPQMKVIVASSTEAVAAAKAETQTNQIPIVMTNVGDPVQRGFVVSLAQPGRNITGLSNVSDRLVGKLLELLRQAVPQLRGADPQQRQVAVMHNGPHQPAHMPQLTVLRGVAAAHGITLHAVQLNRAEEFDRAFNDVLAAHPQALIVLSSALHFAHSRRIADFALTHQLPASSWARTYAANGLLMAYGPNEEHIFERAAHYVDRLLKGAKPADTPVEQPMAFELVINQRTAQQLDLTLPPALYLLATEVIR
ncbi:MAG: ABC transporter substrate-binding protein [Candidatus Tectomicrobia bacterium]|nr:ABC transporter substrate-binding protein [Candidatus Tectomicrobia bacterium]